MAEIIRGGTSPSSLACEVPRASGWLALEIEWWTRWTHDLICPFMCCKWPGKCPVDSVVQCLQKCIYWEKSFAWGCPSATKHAAHLSPSLLLPQFDKWTDIQRRRVLMDLLERCSLSQLKFCVKQLHDRVPVEALDFSTKLPRALSLYIFSFLDPRSLCRCAQVKLSRHEVDVWKESAQRDKSNWVCLA